MKTMKFVLLAVLLLAGTGVFAQRNKDDNNRQNKEKQKTEARSEHKESDAGHSNAAKDPRSRTNRDIVYTEKADVRHSESKENRDSHNRDYEQGRNQQHREQGNDRFEHRNDIRNQNHSRAYSVSRSYDNHPGNYAYDRRNHHDDACPLCYQPRFKRGYSIHYSVSDLASLETNRLSGILDLSDRQIEKIYRINLKYLSRRPGNHFNAMERREREIRNVLRYEQIEAYDLYLEQLDNADFCENCHDGWGKGTFRVAFQLNL